MVGSSRKPLFLALAALMAVIALASLLFISNNSASRSNDPMAALLPNPGFENGLADWVAGYATRNGVSPNQGYTVDIDHTVVHSGTASAHIHPTDPDPKNPPRSIGYISTKIPADIFRGKRVRYSAYLRTEAVDGGRGLYRKCRAR